MDLTIVIQKRNLSVDYSGSFLGRLTKYLGHVLIGNSDGGREGGCDGGQELRLCCELRPKQRPVGNSLEKILLKRLLTTPRQLEEVNKLI